MVVRTNVCAVLAFALGCGGDPPPAPPPVAVPADAAPDGITMIGAYDPNSGSRLDDVDPTAPPAPRTTKRAGRPVEIMLRSTPSGANVSVDGPTVGKTPMTWVGETGEHVFSFYLAGHAFTQYKFLVVQTGVVHARLEPASSGVDAGLPPTHLMQQPISITPPEPLIVKPDAAPPAPETLTAPAPHVAPPLVTPAPLTPDAASQPW